MQPICQKYMVKLSLLSMKSHANLVKWNLLFQITTFNITKMNMEAYHQTILIKNFSFVINVHRLAWWSFRNFIVRQEKFIWCLNHNEPLSKDCFDIIYDNFQQNSKIGLFNFQNKFVGQQLIQSSWKIFFLVACEIQRQSLLLISPILFELKKHT